MEALVSVHVHIGPCRAFPDAPAHSVQASTLLSTLHHSALLWTPPCLLPVPSRTCADLAINLKLSILFGGEDLGFWRQLSSRYQQHKLWVTFRTERPGTGARERRCVRFYFGVRFLLCSKMFLLLHCKAVTDLRCCWGLIFFSPIWEVLKAVFKLKGGGRERDFALLAPPILPWNPLPFIVGHSHCRIRHHRAVPWLSATSKTFLWPGLIFFIYVFSELL